MTRFQLSLIAAAAVLALAACSTFPSAPKTSVAQPPSATAPAQPGAPASPPGGTYPYGTVLTTEAGPAQQANARDEIVVTGPDGTVWIQPGTTSQRRRGDADSCYAYARGQVAHDARIESDVRMAFQSEAGGLGLADLRSRMSYFERTRRLPTLFNNCMVAKGYSRQ